MQLLPFLFLLSVYETKQPFKWSNLEKKKINMILGLKVVKYVSIQIVFNKKWQKIFHNNRMNFGIIVNEISHLGIEPFKISCNIYRITLG